VVLWPFLSRGFSIKYIHLFIQCVLTEYSVIDLAGKIGSSKPSFCCRVLYFSVHRYEYGTFWPNLRQSDYDFIGRGNGRGYNINVPLNQVCCRVCLCVHDAAVTQRHSAVHV